MTSFSADEPRPPPQLPRPPGLSRPSVGRSASHVFSPLDRRPSGPQRQLSDIGEDRPAKRRKVEVDLEVNQAFENPNSSPLDKTADPQPVSKTIQLRWVNPTEMRAKFAKSQNKDEEGNSSEDDIPDFPPRPWKVTQFSKAPEDPKPTHRSRVNIPVPHTPDSIELPSSAPHFVPRKPAGFFPWTGKHPEDILSDTNVKSGYFDKPPNPTEKELHTARVPLYNAFKHKSGVDSLSVLFSLVLEQKSQHDPISSVSTFKPPPRVTLTEIKRKSWIADLANVDVQLRRLSRTIPQGIRGQALLDQCLQSNVPLSRAIWFAKCVCANEIRTLKRKGTTPAITVGAESKWLREWTINVEQFLESHLAQSNLPEWKANIQYALRLTTRLYLENLLDRDHYLDWVLRSFTIADSGRTPFWLMVTHIYKQDLSQFRRRGSRLVQTLIDKFRSLQNGQNSILAPLRQRLRAAIRELLFARSALFLMPDKWPENAKVVRACLDETLLQERQLLDGLNRVNERAMGHNKADVSSVRAPDQALVEILDAVRMPYNISVIDESLKSACSDFTLLMQLCLEWACTRFRYSKTRVYLVTRLIKRWQREGKDVDTPILDFLSAYREKTTSANIHSLRQLVAQLSRSDCFTLSKYMQSLLVRGLPKKGTVRIDTDSIFGAAEIPADDHPENVHFLLDLSLNKAESHAINLRRSILDRAGFNANVEEIVFRQCIRYIEQNLAGLNSISKSDASNMSEPSFAALPWTIRTRISTWLRAKALESAKAAQIGPALPGSNILSEEQFFLIRHILESMEDAAVLADVVGILSTTQNDDLAASLVATIQFHADTFSSIGALEVLQKQLCQAYMNWRPTKPTMPLLASSLLDLCTASPSKVPAVKLLQQDLVRGDRGRAVAACSPYSDGIAESLQQAGATFVEDFEAILQSETNMNEQTMNGLFSVLVDRIEKQQKFEDDARTTFSFCQLLSRLRLCRRGQGDLLIQKWMSRLLPRLDSKWGPLLLRNLLASGCVGFPGLIEAIATSKQGGRRNVALASLLYHTLAPAKGKVPDWATYQTRTKWHEYTRREPRTALEILCEAGLQGVSPTFDSLLLSVLVNDTAAASLSLSGAARQWFVKALSRSLGCGDEQLTGSNLRALFQTINIFSHRYVQLRLQSMSESVANHDELADVLYTSLQRTMQSPPTSAKGQDQRFAQFLQTVGADVATLIRHKVETEFLEALPKLPISKAMSPLTAVFPGDTQQLASVLERAFQVCRKDTTPSPGFMSHLIERLSLHFKSLGQAPLAPTTPVTSAPPVIPGLAGPSTSMIPPPTTATTSTAGAECINGASPTACLQYLRYMLQMVCLQRPALIAAGRAGPNPKQGQSEQVQLLVRLASIATHPATTAASTQQHNKEQQLLAKDVIQTMFDIIATIVDEVSDEVNMMCAKLLKDKFQDGRVRYLFGNINMLGSAQVQDMGQGLQLVKEGKGVIGEWKPRMWEVLDNGSGKENETSLGLGLFGARYG
ncbi:RNA polymerase II mediator complex subunit [Cladophialophora chaetospira]|uniref:Mediator of RNA polymerase II transcription subunit 12 n=1 Tax=Cladophialophora chaetospira TaxID=386627 RepID=A0AA39CIZ4_9EURO|nr:RNA polymerase II mediator complex subunit [Cladophialophora chaetospira]